MRFADIWLVIGTRPEAIKLSPLAHALRDLGMDPTVVVTGQHPGLNLASHGLGDFESIALGCPGEPDPYHHAKRVEERLRPMLRNGPSLLVVQGDTSSAYGAAHAAFISGVPVAHVEAGLRTHDPQLPWPEEEFRTAIDARARLLFAPTDGNAANLMAERIEGTVHVTGNTGVDALEGTVAALPVQGVAETNVRRLLVTCHRRESWGAGLEAIACAVAEIAGWPDVLIEVVLHPNPLVAAPLRERLGEVERVRLLAPMEHRDLVDRLRACDLVLSDSGGIQEEAPLLGVPLLVLRDKTERGEAVDAGHCRLVGVDAQRIVDAVRELMGDPVERAAMARRGHPFGTGGASRRIASLIADWFADRGPRRAVGLG